MAINGQTDAGIPPTGYIQPGADQHLDGYHALWYARGRYGADDYQRMSRQRDVPLAALAAGQPGFVEHARMGRIRAHLLFRSTTSNLHREQPLRLGRFDRQTKIAARTKPPKRRRSVAGTPVQRAAPKGLLEL